MSIRESERGIYIYIYMYVCIKWKFHIKAEIERRKEDEK